MLRIRQKWQNSHFRIQLIYLIFKTFSKRSLEVRGLDSKLGAIMTANATSLEELSGRKIAVDAFNTLYQFLSTIHQPDGTPLMDSQKRVTSHLSGLFYRNAHLLEKGIKPVYVFDGESPKLKATEIERRRGVSEEEHKKWEKALEEGRIEDARSAAQTSSRLTEEIVIESKELLTALGIPAIQAPSEGVALAAQMARERIVWASASQDSDSLLYNCPRMVRNLSISGRRRVSRSKTFKTIHPEIIELDLNLRLLEVTREQLVDIAILIGTDYNDKIPGIGPKTALKLIRVHGTIEQVQTEKGIDIQFPYQEVRDIFLNPPPAEVDPPIWSDPDIDELHRILCVNHDFSRERVDRTMEKLKDVTQKTRGDSRQSSLSDFF
ncbi:MAG: flap endonuclease-1 [Candidatus Thorarchaeota archaeon]|nr:MAG: flap endonuclease-1 [Candidatus Thorarchaeota archaeon]